MTIKIEFTGDDPAAIAQQILTVGFLIRANGAAAAAKKEYPQEAVEAETIDPPKKPGRKAKKPEPVEEAVAEETTPETETGQEVEAPAEPEKTAEEITPEPEQKAEADTPPMTIDELRKYTVGYLTFAHKKLDDQKAEFADLLGQFGVTRIGDLPADKIAAFKALVDERKAKLADA